MYTDEEIQELINDVTWIKYPYNEVYNYFYFREYKNDSKEYAIHDFCRRISILRRCVENIFEIYPPKKEPKAARDMHADTCINLHAFIINVYGSLDNLAWILVKERDIRDKKTGKPLRPKDIGFPFDSTKYKPIWESFSHQLQDYLSTKNEWFSYIEGFRHSLAHRVPLYVPEELTCSENTKQYEFFQIAQDALLEKDLRKNKEFLNKADAIGRNSLLMSNLPDVNMSDNNEDINKRRINPQIIKDIYDVLEISKKFIRMIDQ